jgi:hypothetical protein
LRPVDGAEQSAWLSPGKVICHNICCLISAMHELGLEMPQFGQVALAG